MSKEFATTAQGPAVAIDDDTDEMKKDVDGFTHPNLHRRIDISNPTTSEEVEPRSYELGVYSVDSYRTTTVYTHDEESDSEIP